MRMRHFLAAQRLGRGSHSRKSFSTIRKAFIIYTRSSKHMNFEESNLVQDLVESARKTSSKPPALPDDNESNLRRYIKLVDSFENSGVVRCTIIDGLAPLLETGRPDPGQRSF